MSKLDKNQGESDDFKLLSIFDTWVRIAILVVIFLVWVFFK